MTKYFLSEQADNDILELYHYGIRNFGKEQASNYLMGLHNKLNFICDNKMLGRSAEELSLGLKRILYNHHVIFYQEVGMDILIVRVLRSEMVFEQHLKQ